MAGYDVADVVERIDHTVLTPGVTEEDLLVNLSQVISTGYTPYSFCVASSHIPAVADFVAGSSISVCTVVGFPHGNTSTEAKVAEAKLAVSAGADEVDMVFNRGLFNAGMFDEVCDEIRRVKAETDLLKVIVESAALTPEQVRVATQLVVDAGAEFVKTSTGFDASGGASVEAVRVMRAVAGDRAQVKASGGIRSFSDAVTMLEAGADRLGVSSTLNIIEGSISGAGY